MLNIYHKILSFISILYTFSIKRKFRYFGKSKVYLNTLIVNPKNIIIGNNTIIRSGSWLLAIEDNDKDSVKIEIGDNVYLGHSLHITSLKNVIICDNVIIADRVFITDNNHGFDNISIPIKNQPLVHKKNVIVGAGTWIGENACVIGCCIGQNCIVGANSVVTRDVPDYSVVAGNPAKIIRNINSERREPLNKNNSNQ